MLVFNQHQ